MSEPRVPNPLHGKMKWYYWAGGGLGVAVVYYYYHKRSVAAATAASTATDPNAALAGDPNAYNSATDPYGSYGGYSPAYGYGTQTGAGQASGYYDANGNWVTYTGGSTSTVTTPTTNAQWAQQVESTLTAEGYDPITVSAALGKYLTGQSMSTAQIGIVQTALALQGNPPSPVAAPHSDPVVPPVVGKRPVTGVFYRRLPDGAIYQVMGSLRYGVSYPTWNSFDPKPTPKWVTKADPIFKLKSGGNI